MAGEEELQNKIKLWKAEGYNVARLENLSGIERMLLKIEMEEVERKIQKLKELEKELRNFDLTVVASLDVTVARILKSIHSKLKEPDLLNEVEREIERLEKHIQETGGTGEIISGLKRLEAKSAPRRQPTSEFLVTDIFLIYRDGRLITHQTRRLEPTMDSQILGGMLTAVQGFIQHCLKYDGGEGFRKLEYGKLRILVERGKDVFITIIYSGTEPKETRGKLQDTLKLIESRYSTMLNNWNGDLTALEGTKSILAELMRRL